MAAWKTLFAADGIKLVEPTMDGHAEEPDNDPAMPRDPRPNKWVVPSAGVPEPVDSVAPGWRQSPDGSWKTAWGQIAHFLKPDHILRHLGRLRQALPATPPRL
jgi:hypothetical protein